jgi:hypothetical protein
MWSFLTTVKKVIDLHELCAICWKNIKPEGETSHFDLTDSYSKVMMMTI